MKRQKRHTGSKKRLIITAGIVVVLGAGGFGTYKLVHHNSPAKAQSALIPGTKPIDTINYDPSTPSDNASNNARKSNPDSAAQTLDNGSSSTTQSSTASVTITRASVISGNLEVGTIVSGATSGTCTLSVSQSGQQTVTQTQQISQQDNAYACAVFNVPTTSFANNGPWTVAVSISTTSGTASSSWQGNPVYLK